MSMLRAAMSTFAKKSRRFAPLNPTKTAGSLPRLQGVVFDVDGTLCEPQNYMFGEMRAVLGIQKPTDILDHIYSLPESEQDAAMESIKNIEREAIKSQKAQAGLVPLMDYLNKRNIQKGICTRNFDIPVTHLLESFLPGHFFHPIVTRDFKPPKPSPAGILHIAKQWSLPNANDLIMVGDSIDDMTAGRAAGAATVLLANEANADLAGHGDTDIVIEKLDDLIQILEDGFDSDPAT